MPGQRFIDRLIADTLSERYRPCKEGGDMLDTCCEAVEDAMRAWQKVFKKTESKEVEHMPGQGAVDMIMEAYPLEINSCSWCIDGECSHQLVRTPIQEYEATLKLTSGGLDDHDCLRSPLSRLGDWFAGLFSVGVVAMPID